MNEKYVRFLFKPTTYFANSPLFSDKSPREWSKEKNYVRVFGIKH